MNYASIEKYNFPIELMMENAGLNLARLTTSLVSQSHEILIGVGTGNNGGGGLVAARRLSAWGFDVSLHLVTNSLNELAEIQLNRALATGAKIEFLKDPDLFIDAYLGFSQRIPLSNELTKAIEKTNNFNCKKISLDLPTGFNKTTGELLFKPDYILTLAAMKTELVPLLGTTRILVADLGLPHLIYSDFGVKLPTEFKESGIVECQK
jgi:NAD(P)H-hydrate epimerase